MSTSSGHFIFLKDVSLGNFNATWVSCGHVASPAAHFIWKRAQSTASFITFRLQWKTRAHPSGKHLATPANYHPPIRTLTTSENTKHLSLQVQPCRGCWISSGCQLTRQTPLKAIIKKLISLYRFLSIPLIWG